jgi:hypothetical protein
VKKMMAIDCLYHIGAFAELVPPAVCDFDLNKGDYSWVDESSQNLKSEAEYGNASQSELNYKKTSAYCREKAWIRKDLLGG